MVELVLYPLPLDPAIPPAQIWPGASALVAAIDSALRGQPCPAASIESAWQQAVAQTENLEDAASSRLAAQTDTTSRLHMTTLRWMRLELMRARLAHEAAPNQLLGDQVRVNYAVSMALLGSAVGDAQPLNWLKHTPAPGDAWGCGITSLLAAARR